MGDATADVALAWCAVIGYAGSVRCELCALIGGAGSTMVLGRFYHGLARFFHPHVTDGRAVVNSINPVLFAVKIRR